MRRVRVRWARVVALALAVACVGLVHRVAVLRRAVGDLTEREATLHAAALAAERELARHLIHRCWLPCDLLGPQDQVLAVEVGRGRLASPYQGPWGVVQDELTSSGIWLRLERARR